MNLIVVVIDLRHAIRGLIDYESQKCLTINHDAVFERTTVIDRVIFDERRLNRKRDGIVQDIVIDTINYKKSVQLVSKINSEPLNRVERGHFGFV